MKILSWNINGIRASKIDLKKLLDSLDADIICLQETKVTRDMLDEQTAIVDGYNSYFSFSRKRSGYSGVANYCKDHVTPFRAEEGLSGVLTPSDLNRIVGHYGDHSSFTSDEIDALDAEGRAVITQHKIRLKDGEEKDLAIINVYCPRFDPDREDRHLYKLRFYALLQTRAEALLETGSHVIILGDINTTHKAIDHCDPEEEEVVKKPSRQWLNQMMWVAGRDPTILEVEDREEFVAVTPHTVGGKFVDTYRYIKPDEESAFSNWCSKTNARATNFGRRLDYILCDVPLTQACVTDGLIMREVQGSDHCPVMVELSCQGLPSRTVPGLCTRYMPEFSGKQQKLSMFFTKVRKEDSRTVDDQTGSLTPEICVSENSDIVTKDYEVVNKTEPESSGMNSKRSLDISNNESQPKKKSKTDMKKSNSSGSKQQNLMSFFGKPQGSNSTKLTSFSQLSSIKLSVETIPNNAEGEDKKCSETKSAVTAMAKDNSSSTASAWKNLLGGLGPAPLCKGHNEPCVLRTVKKAGPNKGKQFYTCARGEGHKNNPEARCDYFKWVEKKKSVKS